MNKKELTDVKVYLVQDVSKKTGNPYSAIRVEFTGDDDLNKMVFINRVEAKVYDLYLKERS